MLTHHIRIRAKRGGDELEIAVHSAPTVDPPMLPRAIEQALPQLQAEGWIVAGTEMQTTKESSDERSIRRRRLQDAVRKILDSGNEEAVWTLEIAMGKFIEGD
jgi:hypothetical protein